MTVYTVSYDDVLGVFSSLEKAHEWIEDNISEEWKQWYKRNSIESFIIDDGSKLEIMRKTWE